MISRHKTSTYWFVHDYLILFILSRPGWTLGCSTRLVSHGLPKHLADPGKARGCSTNTFVINWVINWLSDPIVKIFLQCRHALMQPNRTTGSKVTAILLKGWILPLSKVASGRVCACSVRLQRAQQACFWITHTTKQ